MKTNVNENEHKNKTKHGHGHGHGYKMDWTRTTGLDMNIGISRKYVLVIITKFRIIMTLQNFVNVITRN